MKLSWKKYSFDVSERTYVMGILNVTPDSFSDGGLYLDRSAAVERALRMVEDGADMIDVGGESTRPGSDPVPLSEELKRTIPVIEALAKKVTIPISIDTYKAEVARRALEAGASIVNDISGLRFDSEMARVVARHDVPVVVMHMKGTPKDMQADPRYEALIPEILDSLRGSIEIARHSGIREDRIIIDPGIGFGKTYGHNVSIIRHLREFTLLEKPVLVGVSRKAFIGHILGGAPPHERLEGTAAAVALSILNGANIIRVHDVKEMVKVAKAADAIRKGTVP